MESSTFVTKLEPGYCKATFLGDDIFLTVLSGKSAFTGQLDTEKIREIQTNLAGKFKDSVVDMARQAFSKNSEHFSLSVEADQLIWRKIGGKIKLRVAAIPLQQFSEEDAVTEIMDFLLKANADQAGDLKDCQTQLNQKSTDLDSAKNTITAFTNDQVESRNSLVAQFLSILNGKKAYIRQLETQLRNIRNRSPDQNDSDNEEAGTDYEVNTDDEETGEKRKYQDHSDQENSQNEKRKSAKFDDSLEEGLFEDD